MKNSSNKSEAAPLRHKAEGLLKEKWINASLQLSEFEKQKLIHELSVHQIELELQNEELALAEEKLIQSNERYKRITDGLTDYLYTVNVKDGKVLETIHNEACLAITGYTQKELSDDPYLWINMVIPEERDFVVERASEILKGKEQAPCELRIRKKDGEVRWIKNTTIPHYGSNGELVSYDGVLKDITERVYAKQELIKAKEHAEESDRLKSAFLCNMSHEIRTPMNGILGFSELLKESELSGERQQEFLSVIAKSCDRLLNIINDIVDISIIDSCQTNISISQTNVNEQIEHIHSLYMQDAEQKGLQISFINALPTNEAIINTDKNKLGIILSNLVKNALKFTATGHIEIGYESTDSPTDRSMTELIFFVKDTGIGIPKDRQEVIFERFMQADVSNSRAFQGAGLGLAIAKAYVEILGGKIWVESEEGVGSTFYFTLPCHAVPIEKEVTKSTVLAEDDKNRIDKLKVLIAEDDEASEKFLTFTVRSFSKEILKASTGVETVETCRNNPDIDLVIMDIRMPEMDGYEATRQIRLFNKDVVIIAQTAYALSGDREKALEAGCNEYLSKPTGKSYLIELIKKHFNKSGI